VLRESAETGSRSWCSGPRSSAWRTNVIQPGNRPDFGKLLDINLLVVAPGGRERTPEELRTLLGRASLRLRRVVPTESQARILDAVAA
jgi:hypothetical protein